MKKHVNSIINFRWTKILALTFFALLSLLLLVSTVKGSLGNPTAKYIYNHERSAGQPFENSPERNRYAQLLSIVDYHSFTFPLEVAKTVVPDLGYDNGKFVGLYPPGFLFISLPFYAVGKHFGASQLTTFMVPIIMAIIAMFTIVSIGKKLKIGIVSSLISGVLFVFGTSAWAYTTTIYQHLITAAILLIILRLVLAKRNFWTIGAIGILSFYSFLLDTPNIIFAAPFLLYVAFEKCSIDQKAKRIKLVFPKMLIYSVLLVLPLVAGWMVYNYHTYNTPIKISLTVKPIRKFDANDKPVFPKHYSATKENQFLKYEDIPVGMSALFASLDRNVFLYSPFILIGLLGIRGLYKNKKTITILILSAIATIVLVYSSWGDPWGGWAFGPRYLIPALALFSIFIANAIELFKKNKLFIVVLFILGVYSIFISALGAVTTNQVPPYHEAVGINMKYNFLLNFDYIQKDVTGSFVFTKFLSHSISAFQYFVILGLIVSSMFAALIGINFIKKGK